jgi:hypothetical protein
MNHQRFDRVGQPYYRIPSDLTRRIAGECSGEALKIT